MDKNLLNEIYIKYGRELYLYILSLCKDTHIAEDLLQETFVKAFLSLKDAHVNPRAWLYIVGRNLTFNYLRKNKKIVLKDEIDVEQWLEPFEEYFKSEKKKILYKSLLKLDKRKREILMLQYFAGLSIKDIAKLMNLTEQNIKVLAHRGKKELRKYMEDMGYEI